MYISILGFLLGIFLGSFLNCISVRLASNKSFTKGRSQCVWCNHDLSWNDLFPILSFLFLKGKCRYCKKKISWQYPISEILFGLVVATHFYFFDGNILNLVLQIVISSFLFIIFFYDLNHCLIPVDLVYWGIGVYSLYGFVNGYFSSWDKAFSILLGIFIPAGFFWLLYALSGEKWMGAGDVKLMLLLGFLGMPNVLISLLIAVISGGIIGLILIVSKKKTPKSEIPFGPFLIAGYWIALFWGQNLMQLYFNFLFQ